MEPLGAMGHFCTTGSRGALLAVGPYWSRGALGNPRTQGALGVAVEALDPWVQNRCQVPSTPTARKARKAPQKKHEKKHFFLKENIFFEPPA